MHMHAYNTHSGVVVDWMRNELRDRGGIRGNMRRS